MKFKRSAGILLHPTSLPGPYGIGDIGTTALRWIDFLSGAGCGLWQVLPVVPTGYADFSVGDGIARIITSRIGLDAIVVELSGLDDSDNLKRGPGHIPGTAYPGQAGNMVISGHRTTYGAPFRHIEQLLAGDEILLMTADNRYSYEVYDQRIVEPSDLTVLEQGGESKLTLTACHPWYSAAQRIVVISRLTNSEPL